MRILKISLLIFILPITSFAQEFWQHSNGPYAANVLDIAFEPSGTIYISNYFNGLHKSTDSGSSWELVNREVPQGNASKIFVNNKSYIYATTQWLFRSTDNGISGMVFKILLMVE